LASLPVSMTMGWAPKGADTVWMVDMISLWGLERKRAPSRKRKRRGQWAQFEERILKWSLLYS